SRLAHPQLPTAISLFPDTIQARWLLLIVSFSPSAPPLGSCKEPPKIPNAFQESYVGALIPAGTVVKYGCLRGYELVPGKSPGQVTCLQNFTWSEVQNFCQSKYIDTYEYGDTVSIECSPGYGIKGNINSTALTRCRYDGSWDAAIPVFCEQPPDISHGRHNSWAKKKFFIGASVMYTCNRGYTVVGEPLIYCKAGDGVPASWTHPTPECTVCGPPPKINSGQHSGLKTEHFPYGSQVTYRCAEGLSLVGESSIYCTSDDGVNLMWSGPAPECKGDSFPLARRPPPGTVPGDAMDPALPSGCSFGTEGSWGKAGNGAVTQRAFLLTAGDCGPPPRVTHAKPSGANLTGSFPVGSKVTYTCLEGTIKLPGRSDTVECLPGPRWSELSELCDRKYFLSLHQSSLLRLLLRLKFLPFVVAVLQWHFASWRGTKMFPLAAVHESC
uniref:Sushi domain-containing protein n=1 Tax=Apteryx owenii TaxID=8824 RepID=A0A8B9PQV1_APTOW